jgi:PAS domain-containing protein
MASTYLPRLFGAPLFPVPSHDRFLRWAALAAVRRDRGTAQDLARALAPVYPDIHVRVQTELATLGLDPGWYLYRDRLYQPKIDHPGSFTTSASLAILDDAGRLADVDDAAARILGADRLALRGMRLASFIAAEAADLFGGLTQILDEAGSFESRWQIQAIPGRTTRLDVALVSHGAGAHRHLVWMDPAQMPDGRDGRRALPGDDWRTGRRTSSDHDVWR